MTTEAKSKGAELQNIRRKIAAVRARIATYQKQHPGQPFPFARAHGAWKGRVRFTDKDIEAARVRPRHLPE